MPRSPGSNGGPAANSLAACSCVPFRSFRVTTSRSIEVIILLPQPRELVSPSVGLVTRARERRRELRRVAAEHAATLSDMRGDPIVVGGDPLSPGRGVTFSPSEATDDARLQGLPRKLG